MIICRLKGGLGNQLFQYAFGYVLSKKGEDTLYIDVEWFDTEGNVPWLTKRSYELNKFAIPSAKIIKHKNIPVIARFCSHRFVRRLLALGKIDNINVGDWLIVSTTSSFNYMNLPRCKNVLLNGYFDNHAAVYLDGYLDGLREEFKCKIRSDSMQKLLNEIASNEYTTSIHVRRTDQMHETGHKANLEYYKKAIAFIRSKQPNTIFYVFSDDIDWCRVVFSEESNFVFASDKNDKDALRDFVGMKACDNNIIAYSTYSWWAAMLNSNLNKIVVSPHFYDSIDFLPNEWIQIDS